MKSALKYRTLAEMLRSRIQSLPGGSRLPSMRALKQRMGYSIQTINMAVNVLEREGLVVRKHGSGLYVSKSDDVRHIAFCRTNFPSINGQIKENALREACTAREWTLTSYQYFPNQPDFLLDHEVQGDGVVLLPEIINFNYGISKVLLASKTPMVMMGGNANSLDLDFVTGDDSAAMSLILKKLVSLGHRAIAFLVTEPRCYEVDLRVTDFQNMTSLLNLANCQLIECGTKTGQDSGAAAYRAMHALLNKHRKRLPFTAVVSCSSPGSYTAMRALHEHGWRIPGDCSVVCMQEDPLAPFVIPALTNLKWNYANWGEQCIRLIESRLSGKANGTQAVKLVPELNLRESIAAAPKGRRR